VIAPLIALLLIGSAVFALTVITSMLVEYRGKMMAALLFEPMPRTTPRYRAGQMIGAEVRRG